ncbi:MAG: ice-binding family protein [bacterium]|nr:ice-binding family protein [bacterium]
MNIKYSVSCVVLALGLYLPAKAQTVLDLATAGNFAVLAVSTVTNTGNTVVNGNIGVSPGTSVTGFGPGVVNGTIYAGGATAAQAQTDLVTAYNFATGESVTNPGVSAFANQTLTPGVYNSGSSIGVTGTVTLDGNSLANPVFVFQMGSTLTTAISSQIVLTNGARAENVFWQVGSSATLGGSSTFVGTILANTAITAGTGAIVDGRLLAKGGAVTLDGNTISVPVGAVPEPAGTAALFAGFAVLVIGIREIRRRLVLNH